MGSMVWKALAGASAVIATMVAGKVADQVWRTAGQEDVDPADPDSPIVLLLGDGAAGMSLMDVDTLVRHKLPIVVVMGNNSAWGLEKGPMRMVYSYDILADLAPQTRYDEVVRALGGAGELVTRPEAIGPAIDRAFASGVPYLVNIVTDPEIAYPRSTTGL
mgnify:CR=1 FL=1